MYRVLIIVILVLSASCNSRPSYTLSDKIPEIDKEREAKVLSAFFGLDNALPPRTIAISPKAPGKDGMPIVFSHEVDPETLEETDFKITTAKGNVHNPIIATFQPAIEAFELRTVLLIGDYGNYPDDEPIEVEIVGDILARSGQNYKGQKISITPLVEGPFLSYVEYFKLDDEYPYIAEGNGCDCPKDKTETVVRVVWSGGVRALNGKELGDNELENFTITLVNENDTLYVNPFKLADINDNENNIDLCINQKGTPTKVAVKENTAIDPRDDPNPFTESSVVSRW